MILVLSNLYKSKKINLIENIRIQIESYHTEKLKEKMTKILEEKNKLIVKNCLSLKQLLAEGNFGCVYKALLNNEEENTKYEVAVKTLKCGK